MFIRKSLLVNKQYILVSKQSISSTNNYKLKTNIKFQNIIHILVRVLICLDEYTSNILSDKLNKSEFIRNSIIEYNLFKIKINLEYEQNLTQFYKDVRIITRLFL